jgi:transglutaminase-like putative cysteine protease
MRLRVAHSSVYRYDPPAAGVIQVLRLTPRNHEGQYIESWRVEVTPDARLAAREDAFGNITHVFTLNGPLRELHVEVDGQVETQNTNGVVSGTLERFPPSLFLRDTVLTQPDAAIREFAAKIRAASGGALLAELHGLLDRLHDDFAAPDAAEQKAAQQAEQSAGQGNDPTRSTAATAAQAFARGRGDAAATTHIFIAAAHSLGIPARFVVGYFRPAGQAGAQDSSHAWAEAFVPDLGWVGFDPAKGFCPTDAHIRVAIGLDALGAAPVRGTRLGTGGESLAVAIRVDQ